MDLPSLTTAMTSIQIAREAISAALGVREFNAVATALAGVNDQLLKAQESLFVYSTRMADMQSQLSEAKEELRELKRVKSERDQYALFQVSDGVWVYRSNPGGQAVEGATNGAETVHYLCQGCFDKGTKFVLQLSGTHWLCHGCKSTYWTGRYAEPIRYADSDRW